MKKLLILLFLPPFALFGQTNNTNVNISNSKSAMEIMAEQKKLEGITYLGSGEYKLTKIGGSGFVRLEKIKSKALEEIAEIARMENAESEIIRIEEVKTTVGVLPKIYVTYRLIDKQGNILINEDETQKNTENAKKELIDLKELLDMGLITQEEFDEKAVELKKIILGK